MFVKKIEPRETGRTVSCSFLNCSLGLDFRTYCQQGGVFHGSKTTCPCLVSCFFSAALITRVNVEVNRAGILKEGDEWTLRPVAPQVLRQAEAFCIESGREALWNVLLDGKR